MAKRRGRAIDGIVLLDKPTGMSSNQALQRVKRLFRAAKAGHTGSLDPAASGLLPVCLGKATRISGLLLESDKHYRVSARFGEQTASGDLDSEVVATAALPTLTPQAFAELVASFEGEGEQIPPMYSALKHQGQRLYELARAGVEVERPPRRVYIHSIQVESYSPQEFCLRVSVSKGTYIRTLVEDIARKADSLAVTTDLRRTGLGPWPPSCFQDDTTGLSMHSLDSLRSCLEEQGAEALDRVILPIDAALQGYPKITLDEQSSVHIRHGHPVFVAQAPQTGWFRLYGPDNLFLGMGEVLDDGRVAPRRMFAAI